MLAANHFNNDSMMRDIDALLASTGLIPHVDKAHAVGMGASEASGGSVIGTTHIHRDEKTGDYLVRIELPGCKKEDVAVTMKDGTLTVKAERHDVHDESVGGDDDAIEDMEAESATITRRMHSTYDASFQRSWQLPEGTNENDVTGGLDHGLLTINIPVPPPPEGPHDDDSNVKKLAI